MKSYLTILIAILLTSGCDNNKIDDVSCTDTITINQKYFSTDYQLVSHNKNNPRLESIKNYDSSDILSEIKYEYSDDKLTKISNTLEQAFTKTYNVIYNGDKLTKLEFVLGGEEYIISYNTGNISKIEMWIGDDNSSLLHLGDLEFTYHNTELKEIMYYQDINFTDKYLGNNSAPYEPSLISRTVYEQSTVANPLAGNFIFSEYMEFEGGLFNYLPKQVTTYDAQNNVTSDEVFIIETDTNGELSSATSNETTIATVYQCN